MVMNNRNLIIKSKELWFPKNPKVEVKRFLAYPPLFYNRTIFFEVPFRWHKLQKKSLFAIIHDKNNDLIF